MRFKFELIGNDLLLDLDCTLDECIDIALMLVRMQYEDILNHAGKAVARCYCETILKLLNDPNGKVWEVQNDT